MLANKQLLNNASYFLLIFYGECKLLSQRYQRDASVAVLQIGIGLAGFGWAMIREKFALYAKKW